MVLGMLIYEGLDITYHIIKGTYKTILKTYNWYYGIHSNDDVTLLQLENDIKELKDMIIHTSKTNVIMH